MSQYIFVEGTGGALRNVSGNFPVIKLLLRVFKKNVKWNPIPNPDLSLMSIKKLKLCIEREKKGDQVEVSRVGFIA